MPEIITTQDAFVIKWLIGCVGFLVIFLNSILGYWFREVYRMVKEDHELLKQISTEHAVFHKNDTGIK